MNLSDMDLAAAMNSDLIPAPAVDLAAAFRTHEEDGRAVLDRLPTAVEREQISARLKQIEPHLEPLAKCGMTFEVEENDGTRRTLKPKKMIERALAGFFAGYPSLMNADVPGLVKAYSHTLDDVPPGAILRALDDIRKGRVSDRDRKTGRTIPLDPDWPPSSARVHAVAEKALRGPLEELIKLRRILNTKALAWRERSGEERSRMGEKLAELATDMQRQVDAEERVDERAKLRDATARALTEQLILREYAGAGVEPRRSPDGTLISLPLARQLGAA